jgi:chemosensory pili system protein ChpA (sensor histidine kinase/response regulator)
MNTTPTNHQDLGPLIWVRGEIDLALMRAAEALGNDDHPPGAEQLKFAQTHLHQARGALAIVGLDGLTHFCDALEQLFADWHAGRLADSHDAAPLAQRAIASVRGQLDELVAGGIDQPMWLMPLYRDLMALRGEAVVAPSELFFPDLALRPPAPAHPAVQLSPLDRARALRAARGQFERGLLRFLRDDREGLPQMRQAIDAIEHMQSVPTTRAFWWVCGALTDGLAQGAIRGDFFIKRLCARMDVQMRRLLEGSRGVAERLMRDSLYFIATADSATSRIRQVRETYRLDALLARGDTAGHDDLGTLRSALAALRESLGQGKEAWTRFSSGAAVGLPQFHEQCEAMVAAAARVGQPDLARLAAALLDLGQWLRRDPLQHTDNLAMEVATALLVMDALVEQFSRAQSEDLPNQVDTLIDRLARARRGEALPAMQIPLFDEMSRRAQERLFMGHVAREIMASLADVEQQLDGYFRDPSRAAELASLAGPLKQIDGALNMLGQDAAVALVRRAAAQIAEMAKPEHEVAEGEFEALAHQLSGLGFFVDRLQYGPADLDFILNPRSAAEEGDAEDDASVETELTARRERAAQLLDRLSHGGADAHTRDELRQAIETIRQDAKLLADEKLEQRATEALAALKAGEAIPDAAIADAVQGIGQASHESLAPSADTVRLAEASQEEFDAELLDIFIEEAREVLEAMASSTDAVRVQPHRQDLLTTLRRGFHTLKGSGRMVGLRDLGESAFAMEQVMNRWLASERDGVPELFDLLDRARLLFADWVGRLAQGDTRSPDHEWLQSACNAMLAHEPEPIAAAPVTVGADAAADGVPEPIDAHALDIDFDLDLDLDLDMAAAGADLPAADASDPGSAPDVPADQTVDIVMLDEPIDLSAGDIDLELDFDLDAPGAECSLSEGAIDITSGIDTGADSTLFDLFLAEARGHVATLRRELTRLHINPSLRPSQDSLLAAHTLAGISLTVDQHGISALAKALEHALLRCAARAESPETDQSALLNTAAGVLEAQVAAIADGSVAEPDPALIGRLDALFAGAAAVPATVGVPVLELSDPVPARPTYLPPVAGSGVPDDAPLPLESVMVSPSVPVGEASPAEGDFEKVALPDSFLADAQDGRDMPPFDPMRLPAVRSTVLAEDEPSSAVPDEIDQQLLPIFIEEAHDLLRDIGSELRTWREDPEALGASDTLRRQMHTLKGSARMAGVMSFGDLVHNLETLIEQPCAPAQRGALLDELDLGYDRCEERVARLERGELQAPDTEGAEAQAEPAPAAEEDAGVPRDRPTVRVRSDMVDRFVNEAGEMSIARTRIEGELRSLRGSLNDLTDNVQRLRNQLREIEIQAESQMQSRMAAAEAQHEQFDPLEMDRFTRFQELSRMMAESLSDVTTVQYNLIRNLDAADTAIQSQARLNRDLSQALMSVRMVPFSTLEDRLYRVARQAAKETGKKVNLELSNTRIELDREVLEKMTGPIEHLLRNAVAHGIESRAAREAAGKSETGEIVISLTQQTNEVIIELVDDGGGLAFDRIRARAVERGLLGADEEADERRLTGLIYEAGFSTADQLSELAGRGVGMDVVKSATTALGGRIETTSEPGHGTRFRLSLPMTLAVTQSLLVVSGGKTYAIPSSMVKHAHELRGDEASELRQAGGQSWMDNRYTYHYLPRLLGSADAQPGTGTWLLLISAGNELMALEVDALRGNQEVVVKPVGPQLSRLAGLAGATVMADGEVTLIINPVSLASRVGRLADRPDVVQAVPAAPEALPPLIMVVDDSLTVRKVSSRLLEREGYRVVTAKDGVDALEKLADKLPAVMLVDIEMPRMDGFDLTLRVRADERTRDIPIVMITSRIAEKHQAYAREIGVNEYLGKPYDDTHLLQLVAGFTGGSGRR